MTATPNGLSSDFGWGDADDAHALGGVGSAVLLIASSSVYLASVWLAHGFPPLPYFATRVGRLRPRPRTSTCPL